MTRPVRTYEVSISGFDPVLYSARTPSQARMRAFYAFRDAFDVAFKDFLKVARVKRVDDPPGLYRRVSIAGKPATVVLGHGGHYVAFMRDDGDVILYSHPADVREFAAP